METKKEELKEYLIDLDNKISNERYDIGTGIGNEEKLNNLIIQRDNLKIELQEINKKELEDIRIEKERKKEETRLRIEEKNNFIKSLQKETLEYAKKGNKFYTKEELIKILKDIKHLELKNGIQSFRYMSPELKSVSFEIRDIAIKNERTLYTIQHKIRERDYYFKKGILPKNIQGTTQNGTYVEPITKLFGECIKELYNLK